MFSTTPENSFRKPGTEKDKGLNHAKFVGKFLLAMELGRNETRPRTAPGRRVVGK